MYNFTLWIWELSVPHHPSKTQLLCTVYWNMPSKRTFRSKGKSWSVNWILIILLLDIGPEWFPMCKDNGKRSPLLVLGVECWTLCCISVWLTIAYLIKKVFSWIWTDGSVVKSIDCSSKGTWVWFPAPHGGSQLAVTWVPGAQTVSSEPPLRCIVIHEGKTPIHIK